MAVYEASSTRKVIFNARCPNRRGRFHFRPLPSPLAARPGVSPDAAPQGVNTVRAVH